MNAQPQTQRSVSRPVRLSPVVATGLLVSALDPYMCRHLTRGNTPAADQFEDITSTAKNFGFVGQVLMSRGVRERCVSWPDKGDDMQAPERESDRLNHVLVTTVKAIRSARTGNEKVVRLYRTPRDGISQASVEERLLIRSEINDKAIQTVIMLVSEDSKLGSLEDMIFC